MNFRSPMAAVAPAAKRSWPALALCLLMACPGAAQDAAAPDPDVEALLRRFDALRKKDRDRVAESLFQSAWAIEDPFVASLKTLTDPEAFEKRPRVPKHDPRRDFDAAWMIELPFPLRSVYRFGFGTLDRLDAKKKPSSQKARIEQREQIAAMMNGELPDTDLILAGSLRELDDQRTVDRFAGFLARWRDGKESFYEALERTAGTEDSVFHFDIMLEEWVDDFVPKDHADGKQLRRGPDAAQVAFHRAFRNVRLYRELREMIALTFLLPGEAPMPSDLSSYEQKLSSDRHSSRECVEILLEICEGDVNEVIRRVREASPPFLEDPWTAAYPTTQAIDKPFRAALNEVLKDGQRSSQELLSDWRKRRQRIREELSARTRALLLESLGTN